MFLLVGKKKKILKVKYDPDSEIWIELGSSTCANGGSSTFLSRNTIKSAVARIDGKP